MGESFRQVLARVGFSVFVALAAAFFALPMLWLVFAPFDPTPTLAAARPGPPWPTSATSSRTRWC
jgi:multiple sugar transport system permease protein